MPGTKSLSGSESLPEAQDLMLHTPPAKQMAARSAAALVFFIRASFLLSWSHESLSLFLRICAGRFRANLSKNALAHLRQSIFCVKIPKHLDCAKGIADHDRRPATSCKLKRYYTLYRVDGLNFPLKASFLKMAQVRHSVFLVGAKAAC